jgi:hypothetical protein
VDGSLQLRLGAEVICDDDPCGHLVWAVVDPATDTLTHIAVEPPHRSGMARLVAAGGVRAGGDTVRLAGRIADLEHLPAAETTEAPPGDDSLSEFGGNTTLPVVTDRVPAGLVALHDALEVHTPDGRHGLVRGVVVDGGDGRITHVLVEERHLLGHHEVTLPGGGLTALLAGHHP